MGDGGREGSWWGVGGVERWPGKGPEKGKREGAHTHMSVLTADRLHHL